MTWLNGASIRTLAARWGRKQPHDGATRLETIMSSAERIYSIADNHAQTVQVCIDRLHELGATEQLTVLTGRLQKLAIRSNPGDNDKGT
jgi:hypothetical protein